MKKAAPTRGVDPGEAALAELLPRLRALPAAQVKQPRLDMRAAASFVLSQIVPRVSEPKLNKRLQSLPRAEFDHAAVAALQPAALACLTAQARLASAEAQRETVRLPVDLIDEATAVKTRMLRVCTYFFEDHPQLGAELSDIRAGNGYLDLAEDLTRLAAIYRAQSTTVSHDGHFYDKQDVVNATKLATRITSELRGGDKDKTARDLAWRALALLQELYDEVASACRFLERKRDGERNFPSLHSAAGSGRRPSRGKKEASPATPPQPA